MRHGSFGLLEDQDTDPAGAVMRPTAEDPRQRQVYPWGASISFRFTLRLVARIVINMSADLSGSTSV